MKVALVTGAGRGIGKAIAEALRTLGFQVAALDRNDADVRNKKEVEKAVAAIIKKYGRLNVVVNNAGIAIYKPILETTEAEWQDTIATNLTGVFNVTSAALPHLIKERNGVIVNISSLAGHRGHPGLGAYCASKFGVVGFSDVLAMELKGMGVKVYTVCPGGVDTNMYHGISKVESRYVGFSYGSKDIEEERKLILKPEDVAELVVELVLEQKLPSGSQIEIFKRGGKVVRKVL
ncbi:MAG TPA: SDR family oxidoreductase [Candidatus Paceibacterota bacterium]|nr:SDR family oxidoreductase [Candidatus Paceibacterota bacterium]